VVLQCGAGVWLKGLASGDQRRHIGMGNGSTLEVSYTVHVMRYGVSVFDVQ